MIHTLIERNVMINNTFNHYIQDLIFERQSFRDILFIYRASFNYNVIFTGETDHVLHYSHNN